MFFHLFIFILSFIILALSSGWLVKSLSKVASFLSWKEFVVAFFTMALAGAIPNLSVGISSALHKIPHLSFSEILGGNIVDLTLAVALATLVSKKGLTLPSKTVQGSGIFTLIIALLPLVLVSDGKLSQTDGLALILVFLLYIYWLFYKKERFSKAYNATKEKVTLKGIFRNVGLMFLSLFLLLLAAEGIVRSATFFSELWGLPLALIGLLVVGLGNASPEIFFAIQAAKKEEDWLTAGDLMGSVIVTASLVLGIVAVIEPVSIANVSPFVIARFFLVISAVFFLLFMRTGKSITKKEAIFLLFIYLSFIAAEVLFS